ncbi:MAG: hypothetical protein ACHP84_18050 [Caulobacterales bacterium]
MTNPIRPPIWPQATPIQPRTGRAHADTRLAAQRAFFSAALSGKPTVAAPEAATATPQAGKPSAAGGGVEPQAVRIPRPGSIIDILV